MGQSVAVLPRQLATMAATDCREVVAVVPAHVLDGAADLRLRFARPSEFGDVVASFSFIGTSFDATGGRARGPVPRRSVANLFHHFGRMCHLGGPGRGWPSAARLRGGVHRELSAPRRATSRPGSTEESARHASNAQRLSPAVPSTATATSTPSIASAARASSAPSPGAFLPRRAAASVSRVPRNGMTAAPRGRGISPTRRVYPLRSAAGAVRRQGFPRSRARPPLAGWRRCPACRPTGRGGSRGPARPARLPPTPGPSGMPRPVQEDARRGLGVAHGVVFVEHRDDLGETHLPRAPEALHEAPRLHGVVLADGGEAQVVEHPVGRKVHLGRPRATGS